MDVLKKILIVIRIYKRFLNFLGNSIIVVSLTMLILLLISFIYKLFPSFYSLIPALIIVCIIYLIFRILKAKAEEKRNLERDEGLKRNFSSRYQTFLKEKGELFEESTALMTEEENSKVGTNYKLVLFLFLPLTVTLEALLIIFSREKDFEDTKYLFTVYAVVPAVIIFGIYKAFQYKSKLSNNYKTVFKGVITNKFKTKEHNGEAPWLMLSNQKTFPVNAEDYRKVTFGDIVQLDYLDPDDAAITQVTIINKIKMD